MILITRRHWKPMRLGQGAPPVIKIAVVDVNGHPVRGARVSVSVSDEAPAVGETGGDGILATPLRAPYAPSQIVEIVVQKDGYGTVARGTVDEGTRGTIFVKLPVCLPQPLLTPVEVVSLVAGLAFTGAGLYWKFKPAELIGEVLVGSSAFTAIYRHSCM